jgi:hypothetical protein
MQVSHPVAWRAPIEYLAKTLIPTHLNLFCSFLLYSEELLLLRGGFFFFNDSFLLRGLFTFSELVGFVLDGIVVSDASNGHVLSDEGNEADQVKTEEAVVVGIGIEVVEAASVSLVRVVQV